MSRLPSDSRLGAYQKITGRALLGYLGAGPGQDGFVLQSSKATALKFFDREERYQRERDVYEVLTIERLTKIATLNVPRLLRRFDDLRVLELSIVRRPFVRLRRGEAATRDS